MQKEVAIHRMPLRQLLTHTEKAVRDLYDHVQAPMLTQLAEFRDLSRPVRRRSHYPTVITMQNSLRKLLQTQEEVQKLTKNLEEYLNEIREHARREVVNRL